MSLRENPSVVCGYCNTVLDSREEYLDHRREEHSGKHGGGRREVSDEEILRVRREQRRQDEVAALAREALAKAAHGTVRNAVKDAAYRRGEDRSEIIKQATHRVSDALMVLNGAEVDVDVDGGQT